MPLYDVPALVSERVTVNGSPIGTASPAAVLAIVISSVATTWSADVRDVSNSETAAAASRRRATKTTLPERSCSNPCLASGRYG
jgi:hypothetical protein